MGDPIQAPELLLDLAAEPIAQLEVSGRQVRLHASVPPLAGEDGR
jgi:hypothetical protein